MEMSEKIKFLRNKYNLTLEEVGKKVGVGKSTVRKWENGLIANMRRDKIASLADALHTSPAYLMGWTDEMTDKITTDNLFHIEVKKFPLLGNVACGEPIYAAEDRESYVVAGTNIDADFCLRATGDSMINARILEGDIVFVRKQSMVDNGDIAVVVIDESATLKRVYYYPEDGKLCLNSENPKYAPLIYTSEQLNHVRILGKAVAFQSDVI